MQPFSNSNSNLLARFPTRHERDRNPNELIQEESDVANQVEPRGNPLELVKGAVTAFLNPAPEQVAEVVQDFDAPVDLPHSPALTEAFVGEAPVLPLVDPVAALHTAELKDHGANTSTAEPRSSGGQTVVPKGWTFKGDITGLEDMTFECTLVGNIENSNPLAFVAMGPQCKSEGNIKGKKVVLKGTHNGVVNAAGGQVTIEATSKITGDVNYSTIQMNGGIHNFKLQYVPDENGNAS